MANQAAKANNAMARITTSQVKTIVGTELEDLSSFVSTAELIIDEQLKGKGMSDARLQQITLYLAAHFVAMTDRQADSEKFGDASITYNGTTGMGLRGSVHGQQAIALDTSKTLMSMDKPKPQFALLS